MLVQFLVVVVIAGAITTWAIVADQRSWRAAAMIVVGVFFGTYAIMTYPLTTIEAMIWAACLLVSYGVATAIRRRS